MRLRRSGAAAAFLGAWLAAAPSGADVTVSARATTSGFGLGTDAVTVTSIKGLRMRLETTMRGKILTSVVDLERARYVSLDHEGRKAQVFDMRPYAARLRGGREPAVALTSTGRTRAFASQECMEYTIEASATVPESATVVRLEVRGEAWVAPGSPGRGDWATFHRAVVERGLFFTDPRVAELDPAKARTIGAVYAGIADRGVPCSTRLELAFKSSSTDAGSPSQAGAATIETFVTDVSTTALPETLFDVPADYTVVRR